MFKMTKTVISLTVVLAIAGCSSQPYQQKTLTEQLNYSNEIAQKFTVDSAWWQSYNDAELNQLVAMALTKNVDLAQSALTMRKAMYQANLKELDLFPTPNATLGGSTGRNLYQHDKFSDNRNFSGEISLNYELDLWQKLGNISDAATFEYQATYYDLENTRLTLINSVIDVYFNLVYLNNAVVVTKNNLDNYNQMQQIVNAKYHNGKTDQLDSLQILQNIKSYQNDLLNFQTQIKDNEQLLRNLLNISPYAKLNIIYPEMLDITPLTIDLDVPLAVLANRPDLKASESRVNSAFNNMQAENKSWYPAITLNTALSSSDKHIDNALDFPVLLGSVSISLPFLNWHTIQNNINISKAEYESTMLGFESDINTALNELAYYYFAYNNNQTIFDNTQAKNRADIKIKQLYQNLYNNGKAEFKDLLDSINTVNTSKLALLNEKYQVIKYENMLFKAMGGRYHATN